MCKRGGPIRSATTHAGRPVASATTVVDMPSLDAVGIIAADPDASLAFYGRLGLEFTAYGEGHHEAVMTNGFRLMIDSVELIESFSTYEPSTGGRNVALAFACDSPADVDAVFAVLTDSGAPVAEAPFDAHWGQRYATVLDPDDNPVDLFAAL